MISFKRFLKSFAAKLAGVNLEQQLVLENEYLREENKAMQALLKRSRQRILLTDEQRYSLSEKAFKLGKRIYDVVSIVKPETILKWHRKFVSAKFDSSQSPRNCGRPATQDYIVRIITEISSANPSWGSLRITGVLKEMGLRLSNSTVALIMKRHGMKPDGSPKHKMSWRDFIRIHKELLWATDFFTSEVWTLGGLRSFYVLFFIHINTRQIVLGGITPHPDGRWMAQAARNLSGFDGALVKARYLIHDRDAMYTAQFDVILHSSGIDIIKLPPRSPNLNAFAERFVLSIKTECLEHLILFGERSLRKAVSEYIAHYHHERPHQAWTTKFRFLSKSQPNRLNPRQN